MAAQIVSQVMGQLGSIITEELKQRGRLVLGAEKDVKKLTSTFTAIEALLLDAEERQLKDKGVEDWLNKLKDKTYEIDDVLDEWRTEILKRQLEADLDDQHVRRGWLELKLLEVSNVLKRVCPFLPAYCFSPEEIGLRYDIASRIKELNESLEDIAKEKDKYNLTAREGIVYRSLQTGPNINFSEVKGREKEIEMLKLRLLDDQISSNGSRIQSISIQGAGGFGKTTLAKVMYNDEAVKAHFKKRIWVCVSDTFDQVAVAKAMLESLSGSTPPENQTLAFMLERIEALTENERFLLVLDDVWEANRIKWEQTRNSVSCGSLGSKILLTTRKEEVSRAFDCIDINVLHTKKMSDDACWAIFTQIAFCGWSAEEKERVKDLCERVVKKCYGSPLAAKVLGGVMQPKRSRRDWLRLLGSELWAMKEAREDVLGPLALSYYDLPPALRQCFQFCSVFPKDFKMEKDTLIKLWMAHDFLGATDNDQDMEGIGEDYFQILLMRSFFQDIEKIEDAVGHSTYCKMHDLVHDFSRLVSKNECISLTEGGAENLTGGATSIISSSRSRHFMAKSGYGIGDGAMLTSLFSLIKHSNCYSQNLTTIDADAVYSDHRLRGIRSLLLEDFSSLDEPWSTIIFQLIDLRSLVLRHCRLTEISTRISQLIHLRYLDLSNNVRLNELGEEVCELYNLETLLLNGNYNLVKLPNGMWNKLVNLKHLENEDVPASLPRSMGRLGASLKTLSVFDINIIDDDDQKGGTNVGALEGMDQLQGGLKVKGLSKLTDGEQVELARKKNLTDLYLQFQVGEEIEEAEVNEASRKDEQVLEAIRPPSTSLTGLYVVLYLGRSMWPSWLISLDNLTTLTLTMCPLMDCLPPLGTLPSLEKLHLRYLAVKKVGREFLGRVVVKQQQQQQGRHIHGAHTIAFPRLTTLCFELMLYWEEWELDDDDEEEEEEENMSFVTVMPRLRSLQLYYCEKLEKLPDALLRKTTLERVEISRSGGFGSYRFDSELPKMVPREVWDKISHIPVLIFDEINIRTEFKSEIESMSGVGCSNSTKQEAAGDHDRDDICTWSSPARRIFRRNREIAYII